MRLALTDAQGRSLGLKEIPQAATIERHSLPVGTHATGILLLRVSTPGESRVIKLINER